MVVVAFSGFANAATPQSDTIALRQTSSSLKSASDNLSFHTYGWLVSNDAILSASFLLSLVSIF